MFFFLWPLLLLKGGCGWPPDRFLLDGESMYNPLHAGGGQDVLAMHLPFAAGYESQCVQGVAGPYSHQGVSTYYDVDFDTPNDRDVPLFAPAPGVARVHDDPASGFGLHVNIDLGDGTYIVLGHLARIQVLDGARVAEGTFLGFEGTTGNSTGDHVHIGRHRGDPALDAARGTSIEGLKFSLDDVTEGQAEVGRTVKELTCSLGAGRVYRSRLPVVRQLPEGLVFKRSDSATVYKMVEGQARPFYTESVFLGSNEEWSEVLVFPPDILDCLSVGPMLTTSRPTLAARSSTDGSLWLVHAGADSQWAGAERLPTVGWQGVLKTWHLPGSTLDEIPTDLMLGVPLQTLPRVGLATYRTGSLVRNTTSSTVYLIQGDGAWPVDHIRTLELLGLGEREVVMVGDAEFAQIARNAGSCGADVRCYRASLATTCRSAPVVAEVTAQAADFNQTDLSEEALELELALDSSPLEPGGHPQLVTVTLDQSPVGNWPLWLWNESRWLGDWPGLSDTTCAIGAGPVHSCSPTHLESGNLIWLNGEVLGGWLVEAADGRLVDRIHSVEIGGQTYPINEVRGQPRRGECTYRSPPTNDLQCRLR
jgi:hypothetical protein